MNYTIFKQKKHQKGFTLIELLIVVAIVTILAVAVFTALNPAQRLKDAKDSRRSTDAGQILSAIHQYIVDNKGSFPANMPAAATEVQLGTGVAGCAIATAGCGVVAAACNDLMTGVGNLSTYLKSMPVDPSAGATYTAAKTGYSIIRDANGIVTVRACGTEGATNISASQ